MIVTYGMGVYWAMAAAEHFPGKVTWWTYARWCRWTRTR